MVRHVMFWHIPYRECRRILLAKRLILPKYRFLIWTTKLTTSMELLGLRHDREIRSKRSLRWALCLTTTCQGSVGLPFHTAVDSILRILPL